MDLQLILIIVVFLAAVLFFVRRMVLIIHGKNKSGCEKCGIEKNTPGKL